MKLFVKAAFVALIAAPAAAQEAVIEPGMATMRCLDVIEEINAASEILGGAPERGLVSTDQAVNLASNIGQRLAIDQGHDRLSTGIGLAGRVIRGRSRAREAEAAAQREEATRRWYYLSGVYDARDCDNRIADEMAGLD